MQKACTITTLERVNPSTLSNEQLFISLYEQFYEKVYNCALHYTGEQGMAEDAAQTVFMKVWQSMATLSGKFKCWRNWKAYLLIGARNTAYNQIKSGNRKRKNQSRYALVLNETVNHDVLFEKECSLIFSNAIYNLSNQQKEIFILTYYSFKQDTIARKLGITKRTVSNTLNSARKKLKAQLVEYLN